MFATPHPSLTSQEKHDKAKAEALKAAEVDANVRLAKAIAEARADGDSG